MKTDRVGDRFHRNLDKVVQRVSEVSVEVKLVYLVSTCLMVFSSFSAGTGLMESLIATEHQELSVISFVGADVLNASNSLANPENFRDAADSVRDCMVKP